MWKSIKFKPSLELRIGFRGESTTMEGGSRTRIELCFDRMECWESADCRAIAVSVNNVKSFCGATDCGCLVSVAQRRPLSGGIRFYYGLLDTRFTADQRPFQFSFFAVNKLRSRALLRTRRYPGAKVIPSG